MSNCLEGQEVTQELLLKPSFEQQPLSRLGKAARQHSLFSSGALFNA